jgi:DNA gyrase subunit B
MKIKNKMTTWKEHIRKRPGMYIGDLRLTGFKVMLGYFFEELVADSLQDPIFEIKFHKNSKIEINIKNVDTQKTISRINELHTNSQTIGSFGFAVLISLTEKIEIIVNDFPNKLSLNGKKGDYVISQILTKDKNNTISIDFILDKDIFKDLEIIYEYLNSFLKQFSYLNPNLKIVSIDKSKSEEQKNIFHHKRGILNQLDYLISQQPYAQPSKNIEIDTIIDDYVIKIGLNYSSIWLEKSIIKTFANNVETFLGGSLNDGIISGVIIAIKKLAEKENIKISISKNNVVDQLILVAAVRGNNLEFSGSTKSKLGMPSLQKKIKNLVFGVLTKYFFDEPQEAQKIIAKFEIYEDSN